MTASPHFSGLERSLSSWSAVKFFLALFVLSQGWIIMTLGETGEDVGRLQTMCLRYPTDPAATGHAARQVLEKWTTRDIHNFEHHFLIDLWIHPILYALFYTSAFLHDLIHRQENANTESTINPVFVGRSGVLVIFSAALCDILENVRHKSITFDSNNGVIAPDQMMYEACVFASTKWFIMGAVSLWLLFRYFSAPTRAAAKSD
ncbi:expressed unknown protein [Seminavis robusta]|uniref:Uncharacterized protein n=1 Tax=Seminavis robusta TaxID=568900 RepID=A0A9N8E792_9STRA|nr:expressed unknown protein [Seminavis robusta]|eukprot:Sro696_g188880.1 n/a (204) ;mRNA; f:24270-24881